MNLDALLTYFGILVAALAIMGSVQRKSLVIFVPRWLLILPTTLAIVFLIVRDMPPGLRPIFGWRQDMATYSLTLGAFIIPVLGAMAGWLLWYRARLTGSNIPYLKALFDTALQKGEFDEVDRVLRKNHDRLLSLPAGASAVLFQPRMVKHLVEAHSVIHLELLANRQFLESLENRLQAVEVVVRQLPSAETSPLQSVVVSRYGGIEHLEYTKEEAELISTTFLCPEWYKAANAHYPLLIAAKDKIESGQLDKVYNRPSKSYEADQGVSSRSNCPIYLSEKMEVLAIEAALNAGDQGDFYISDFFNLTDLIFDRSTFDIVSASTSGIRGALTPYSYLLDQIAQDLEYLTAKAVQASLKKNKSAPDDSVPDRVGMDLIRTWSMCIWLIMSEPGKIDPDLCRNIVERYFLFMFACGFEPNELPVHQIHGGVSLKHWRDALLKDLKDMLRSPHMQHIQTLKEVFKSLDFPKQFIFEGYDWVKAELPAQFLP